LARRLAGIVAAGMSGGLCRRGSLPSTVGRKLGWQPGVCDGRG